MPKEKICKNTVHEMPVIGREGIHPVRVVKILDNTAVVELMNPSVIELGLVHLSEWNQKKEKKKRTKDPIRPFSFR